MQRARSPDLSWHYGWSSRHYNVFEDELDFFWTRHLERGSLCLVEVEVLLVNRLDLDIDGGKPGAGVNN